jgi:hypothetical protein
VNIPSPQEIAREAREALAKSRETPREHFDRLIREGFINSKGEVTRKLGGDAEPEVPVDRKSPGD